MPSTFHIPISTPTQILACKHGELSEMQKSRYTLEFPLRNNHLALFNTLYGSIDLLDDCGTQTWRDVLRGNDKNQELSYFVERGYIVTATDEETNILIDKNTHFIKARDCAPRSYIIVPTLSCNLRCKYCFQDNTYKKTEGHMTPDVLQKAFDFLDSEQSRYVPTSPPTILVLGGEVFVERAAMHDIVDAILSACEERVWKIEFITNAVELASYIPRLASSNIIDHIQVSLDGPQLVNDARKKSLGGVSSPFLASVANIKHAVEAGLSTLIRLNIDNQNIRYVPEFMEWLCQQSWFRRDSCNIYPAPVKSYGQQYQHCMSPSDMYECLFQMSNAHEAVRQMRFVGCAVMTRVRSSIETARAPFPIFDFCPANRSLFSFGPDGRLYSCLAAVGDRAHAVGTFWPELYIDEGALMPWRQHSIFTQEACKACRVALACGGGCAYEAVRHNGTMGQPYCEPVESLLQQTFSHYLEDRL